MPLQQNPQVERMQSRRLEVLVVPVVFQSRRPCKPFGLYRTKGLCVPRVGCGCKSHVLSACLAACCAGRGCGRSARGGCGRGRLPFNLARVKHRCFVSNKCMSVCLSEDMARVEETRQVAFLKHSFPVLLESSFKCCPCHLFAMVSVSPRNKL